MIRNNTITLKSGDVVVVSYDLEEMLAIVALSAVANHSGKAIAQGGLIKGRVAKRVTDSARTRRSKERAARQTEAAASDFSYREGGSVVSLFPQTDAAKQWVETHLPENAPTLGSSYVIEWRYFPGILEGIQDDGLTIKENR
jgi:hypothetical protein